MTVNENKILRNFESRLIKSVLILNFYIFVRNLIKILRKKVAKFFPNSFLVLSEQSRTKLKDCHKNQNQTKTR
jgi:hypothetical protein